MVKTSDMFEFVGSWEKDDVESRQGSDLNEMGRSCEEGRRWKGTREVPTCGT